MSRSFGITLLLAMAMLTPLGFADDFDKAIEGRFKLECTNFWLIPIPFMWRLSRQKKNCPM